MTIRTITLCNYRIFRELELGLDPRCSVIVGKNAAGKSALLEALAIAAGAFFSSLNGVAKHGFRKTDANRRCYPMGDSIDVQPQYPVRISAEGSVAGEDVRWTRELSSSGRTTAAGSGQMTALSARCQKRLQEGDEKLILPLIAYYGTGRIWDYHRRKKSDFFKTYTRTNGYADCLDGTANLKLMLNWFRKMEVRRAQGGGFPGEGRAAQDGLPVLSAVYRAMERCIRLFSGCGECRIRYDLDTNDLDVVCRGGGGGAERIPMSLLSDGYKSTISLVADIAYRMAVLNPQLSDSVLEKTGGVVLIDEIDQHLHPEWQQRVLGDLMDIFPKIQFVATTHAPAVVNSVRGRHLVILKDGRVVRPDTETYGKDVNSVLREIMETDGRPEEVAGKFRAFYDLLSAGDFTGAECVLDEIGAARAHHDPELASCRVKLKLERLRRGCG